VSFPLVGNPSDCSGSQERFWTSQNERNKELRQRPQGVKIYKLLSNVRIIRIKEERGEKYEEVNLMVYHCNHDNDFGMFVNAISERRRTV
jgi:hypothetical protein